MIITFEGADGTGKTTQSSLLGAWLDQQELPWFSFREPGGSAFSERVRELFLNEELDALTELLLILAARRHNIQEIINPAVAAGRIVIIDRFIDSSLVYQGIAGGIGVEKTRSLMEQTGTWLEPEFTFILDVDEDEANGRIAAEVRTRFDDRDLAYHRCIREGFLEIATASRHHIIDTARPREAASDEIISIVSARLGV